MNLLKIFVRSAVSQVGRDGGRVISNKVYGDKHSIPIRNIQNHGVVEVDGNVISADFIPEPWLSNRWWFYVITLIAMPFLFWLYSFLFLGMGITYFAKKETNLKVKKRVNVYTNDKRYSTGQRLLGQREQIELVAVEAPEEHRQRYRLKGAIYLIISVVLFYFTMQVLIDWGWISF
jgi:hypothetical protein